MILPTTIDFETYKIEPRPDYPPKPIGVGIYEPGRKPRYMTWKAGDGRNNCTKAEAHNELRRHWKGPRPLLFHGAQFDLCVAKEHFDLPIPVPSKIHCTTILAFLDDPNRPGLSLKPLAKEVLGMPPEEQEDLRDWIHAHVPETKRLKKGWAAHIARGPAHLVGKYCKGDVIRTRKLFDHFVPRVLPEMAEAYNRELSLIPRLLAMSKRGVPVNRRALRREIVRMEGIVEVVDYWLWEKCGQEFDVDKKGELADALEAGDFVEEWIITDTGKRSVAFDNLLEVCLDEEIVSVLGYRSKVTNALRTFARPWHTMAENTDRIFCEWNAVRQANERSAGRAFGARTGRFSSTPNLQNIPKVPDAVVFTKKEAKRVRATGETAWLLPRWFTNENIVFDLPHLRELIEAAVHHVFVNRDYNQQELRILAHYVRGKILAAYLKNPRLDLHEFARQLVNNALGTNYPRKPIKNVGFGIIYGSGIAKTAEMINSDPAEAKRIRTAYKDELGGIAELEKELRARAKAGEPFYTWGGRRNYVEPPKVIDGRRQSFEYKMINTLVQGSAGDCTKEAMLRYDERDAPLLLSVHDELLLHTRRSNVHVANNRLRQAMESVEFDLPMLSDGKVGKRWANMRKTR